MTTYTATYSPDDNKLRLYASTRLDAETYAAIKAAGFSWAPKQELFVAPMWTPGRADLLESLAGEIGDEDTSLIERAEARADRFEDFAERRTADAAAAHKAVASIVEHIPLGQPILVGHHSERHARADVKRIENGMRRAVKMWETADYWQDRAAGAVRAAKYKESAPVRARRIKGLEADARKHAKEKAEIEKFLRLWTTPGLTIEQARAIANVCHLSAGLNVAPHPTLPNHHWLAWDVLQPDEQRYRGCPAMTPAEIAEIARRSYPRRIARHDRWLAHINGRLAYERAMLGDVGGIASDRTKPEKGGAVRSWAGPRGGWSYVQKVNKVSVTLLDNWGNGGRNFTRNIPFDKLTAIMSAADVAVAKEAGRLVETEDGTGFFLADAPPPVSRPAPDVKSEERAATEAALKAGVAVAVVIQLFPTPPALAAEVVREADLVAGVEVLEPSAGTGNLLRALPEGVRAFAVEVDGRLCDALAREFAAPADAAQGLCRNVLQADFIGLTPAEIGTYDRVVMNPPFANGADIKHIMHARRFLRPGGRLVAICAGGPRQEEALRPLASSWRVLPAGSFASEGTNVNAVLLTMEPTP